MQIADVATIPLFNSRLSSRLVTAAQEDSIRTFLHTSSQGEFRVKEGEAVSFLCSWTPGRLRYGDIDVDGDSIYAHPVYGPIVEQEDPSERIYFTQNETLGVATLTIKDVSMSDKHWFACVVSRIGPAEPIFLEVVGPDPEPTTSTLPSPPPPTKPPPTLPVTTSEGILTLNPTTDWVPRPTEEGENEIEVEFGGLKVDIDLEEIIQKWFF